MNRNIIAFSIVADGATGAEQQAKRHRPHLNRNSERGGCYVEGYHIGYKNAAADAAKKGRPSHTGAPAKGTNERA